MIFLVWLIGGLLLGFLTARPAMAAFGESPIVVILLLAVYGPLYWVVMMLYPWFAKWSDKR